MKHFVRIVFSILFFLSFLSGSSKEVSKSKAKIVAENFFSERKTISASEIVFGEDFTITQNSFPVFYVFNINDGFIIISADDAVYPVLGYSFEGNYSGENFSPAYEAWIKSYEDQIAYAIENKLSATEKIKFIWKKYLTGDFIPAKSFISVDPLLSTTWGQGCYYNSMFPEEEEGPCGHLYTGCVATAMGQIMKYYNYPEHGTGSYEYTDPNYGWVYADFENTYYNWTEMGNHLEEENQAVAELLYHCAISINSQFYPNGTGAIDTSVRYALTEYFGYKQEAEFLWRDEYTGDWKALMRNELDQNIPVLYGAVCEDKILYGHTFVCDGYQDTAFFHFNWGWEGQYNGYYYLDTLTAGGYNFDLFHDAVVGIKPDISGINGSHSRENMFTIYPNPASDYLIVDLKDINAKSVEIILFDLSGKQVLTKRIFNHSNNDIKFKLPELSGTFILQVKSGAINYNRKVVLLK
ncbi:MAG: thiol protease/hemagglutinin PrtT [Bacteroidales bacterium]|nr:thiol protease/hemagglutinin PrtT [Bacteroidales bacterium]